MTHLIANRLTFLAAPGLRTLAARALALLAFALCAFAPAASSAQTPTTFVVSGVRVDVTSQNATQARTEAFAKAPAAAWSRLAARLMLDANAPPPPPPEGIEMDRIVQAITVEDERRSGTRYIGLFAVSFRADQVRALFNQSGLAIVDQRGQPLLVAPTMVNATPAQLTAWRTAWEQGGFGQDLRPIAVAPAALIGAPDWTLVASAAANAGAPTAVFVEAARQTNAVTATLVEVGPNGFRRERGRISQAVRGGDAGLEEAFRLLAAKANDIVQTEYKALLTSGEAPTPRQAQKVSLSALYSGITEWTKIKRGLDAAEDSLVRDVRIEAINRAGALVSFNTNGDMEQLEKELVRHGLTVGQSGFGAVLRVQGGR